jgi:ABC-2 type transport system ATP-binding protein
MNAIISVEQLEKYFKLGIQREGLVGALRGLVAREQRIVKAVDGVTFNIAPGELVGYLGPNGRANRPRSRC